MKMTAAFIAGDWGLSHLRLWLCDGAGTVLDNRRGMGVAGVKGAFATILGGLVADWPCCPVVLCGMVGSTVGWKNVPYIPAPAAPDDIARGLHRFSHDGRTVTIAPGVCGTSEFGAPDVMRGEETQIIGAMRLRPELGKGVHQFCLPGTHTKWVEVRDGRIETITTAVSGELLALLCNHSVLCDGAADPDEDSDPDKAFRLGLSRSDVPLLSALFEVRSRRLAGDLAPDELQLFLSGVIVGRDVQRARAASVIVVGAKPLNGIYAEALQRRGVTATCLDGSDCSIAGLAFYRCD